MGCIDSRLIVPRYTPPSSTRQHADFRLEIRLLHWPFKRFPKLEDLYSIRRPYIVIQQTV